jgi:hypothetical protein
LVQFKSLPPKKDVCATQSPHQHPSVWVYWQEEKEESHSS